HLRQTVRARAPSATSRPRFGGLQVVDELAGVLQRQVIGTLDAEAVAKLMRQVHVLAAGNGMNGPHLRGGRPAAVGASPAILGPVSRGRRVDTASGASGRLAVLVSGLAFSAAI